MTPFITFYTPTHRRPQALGACLRSVWQQTAVGEVEQLVVPDHVGLGIGGMYRRIPDYAAAVHGRYVHLLADDDELAAPNVVEQLIRFAERESNPPVIIVRAEKDGMEFPLGMPWPPRQGEIDLGCLVTRVDVWRRHVGDYGNRYEGDFDFANALAAAGHLVAYCPVLFLRGAVLRGRPEAA